MAGTERRDAVWFEKTKRRIKRIHAKDGFDKTRLRRRYQKLSNQLREVIKGCGMRLGKIAKYSGVKLESIKKFMAAGEKELKLHNFEMLCEFFGLSLEMKTTCTVHTKPS